MQRNLLRLILLVILVLSIPGSAVTEMPKVNDILAKIDNMLELNADGTARVKMTQQRAGEGTKVSEMIYYRRDRDDCFLIVFIAPETEKGNGYLRDGENFWLYRRNTRTFQHINRAESIGGTNARAEDFENKKLREMYKPALDNNNNEKISETILGNVPVYQIELEATTEDVTYPKAIYWVRKDNYLPLKVQSFSGNGTLMQTAYYLKYASINDKFLYEKAMCVNELEKGNKTLIEVSEISQSGIPDNVFTKAYLESLSK